MIRTRIALFALASAALAFPLVACSSSDSSSSSTSSGSGSSSSSASSQPTAYTCADLKACCDKITDAAKKQNCETSYNGSLNNDQICSGSYGGFKPYCP